jgi:O-antigen ligase
MALPFAIMWPIAAALRSGKLAIACLGAVAAITLLMGIALSFSRMGIVATVLACVTMGSLAVAASLPTKKGVLPVAAVCAAGLASFFLFPPLELIQRFSTGDEGRVAVWRDTLPLIRAFPVFGCGLGGYESAFTRYKASLPMFNQDYAHNDYLQGLAELGIAGFAIVTTLGIVALKGAVRSIWTRETMYLGLACVGAITAIGVHSAADFNLYVPANATVLAWILGISVGVL